MEVKVIQEITVSQQYIDLMNKKRSYKKTADESIVFAACQSIKHKKTYYVIPSAVGYHVITDASQINRSFGYYEVNGQSVKRCEFF